MPIKSLIIDPQTGRQASVEDSEEKNALVLQTRLTRIPPKRRNGKNTMAGKKRNRTQEKTTKTKEKTISERIRSLS